MMIDCHTHLSKVNHPGQTFTTIRDHLLASMARNGIDYAFIYPDSESNTDVTDLDTTLELVESCPKLRMLGTTPIPFAVPTIIAKLDRLAEAKKIIGVKLYPGFELFYPDDRQCYPVYELCVRHNMPVVFHSGETMGEVWREAYNHPARIAQVAQDFPNLRIVITHFSQPHLAACRDVILNIPNVYADISGLAYPDVVQRCGEQAIVQVLEGVLVNQPKKILFGTDWPICDAAQHLNLVKSLPVSDDAKALILSNNAERVFAANLK